jgi:hypothetical protein
VIVKACTLEVVCNTAPVAFGANFSCASPRSETFRAEATLLTFPVDRRTKLSIPYRTSRVSDSSRGCDNSRNQPVSWMKVVLKTSNIVRGIRQ